MFVTDPKRIMTDRQQHLDMSVIRRLEEFLRLRMHQEFSAVRSFSVTGYQLWQVAGEMAEPEVEGQVNPYLDQIVFWFGLEGIRVSILEDDTQPGGYFLEFTWKPEQPD